MNIEFFDINDPLIIPSIVVIYSKHYQKLVMCKHIGRDTWEIPGGHIEKNESPENAAKRELYEETGAIKFELNPICKYSFELGEKTVYSMMFEADILDFENLPNFEIEKIEFFDKIPNNLTYPEIYKELFKKIGG